MALINETQKNVIAALKEDLQTKHINVHLHNSNCIVSNCVFVDDVTIDDDDIIITQGNFIIKLNIDNTKEIDIQYFGEDDSYFIKLDQTEIYFDIM